MVFHSTRSLSERYDLGGSDDIVNTVGYISLEGTGTQVQSFIKSRVTARLLARIIYGLSLRAQFLDALSASAARHT